MISLSLRQYIWRKIIQSLQNHLNWSCAFLKHHHHHTWTSSSFHAFFSDEIVITELHRHHHYSIMTSKSIFQDLSFNEIVNSTLTRHNYMSKWTKTRNHERRSHISDSLDTNSKTFIYIVSNISMCLVLCRVVWWWVANHESKWFSQYEDDRHQQQSQRYEKQYHIWSEFAKSWIVSSLISNQRRLNGLEHLFAIVDNLISRSRTVSKHGWECSLRYLVSSESAIVENCVAFHW